MANYVAGRSCRSSCKSPRTLQKCNLLITRQLTFGAVLGEHKLSLPSIRLKVNHLCIRCLCFESVCGDLQEGHLYDSRCHLPIFPSTKSRFLCAFAFRNPRFRAFRAQNLGFCARKVAKMLGKRWMGHREEVDGASGITKMTFVKLIVHSNTHCYLRCPDHLPVPGAGRTTKKDDQYLLVVLFCLACVLSVFTRQAAICSVLERR